MIALHIQPWWVYLVRGVASLTLGLLALCAPRLSLLGLVVLYAGYALVSGFAALTGGVDRRVLDGWPLDLLGLFSIGSGVAVIAYPSITAFALAVIIGTNALIMGVSDVALGLRTWRLGTGGWLMIAGLASLSFALYVLVCPTAGARSLAWLLSLYLFFTGAIFVALGLGCRRGSFGALPPLPFSSP